MLKFEYGISVSARLTSILNTNVSPFYFSSFASSWFLVRLLCGIQPVIIWFLLFCDPRDWVFLIWFAVTLTTPRELVSSSTRLSEMTSNHRHAPSSLWWESREDVNDRIEVAQVDPYSLEPIASDNVHAICLNYCFGSQFHFDILLLFSICVFALCRWAFSYFDFILLCICFNSNAILSSLSVSRSPGKIERLHTQAKVFSVVISCHRWECVCLWMCTKAIAIVVVSHKPFHRNI